MKAKDIAPENDQNVLFQPSFVPDTTEYIQSDGQSLSTNVNDKM